MRSTQFWIRAHAWLSILWLNSLSNISLAFFIQLDIIAFYILCVKKACAGTYLRSAGRHRKKQRYPYMFMYAAYELKFCSFCGMVIRLVEFSNGGSKFEKKMLKNQNTERKLLNFENWINGGLRSFQKVLKINYCHPPNNSIEIKPWFYFEVIFS